MSAVESHSPASVATVPSDDNDVEVGVDAAPATASIARPQEITDNEDLFERIDVADTRSPTAIDRANLLKVFAAIGAASKAAGERGHVANSTQFAIAVLSFWFAKNPKFTTELERLKFRIPTGKKEFAGAASYIYGLNTGYDDGKRTTSKRVTSLCSQYEGLLRELNERGLRRDDFDFGRDSARRLVAIITDAGGTNALEHAPKEDKDEDPKPIPLSAERKGNVLYLRGKEALSDQGEPTFRMPLEVVRPNGSVERKGEAAQALIEAVVADTATALPRTQALAELLEMGGCVLVEQSSQPKKHGADPNDPNTEKRPDERQLVFHENGRVTQSPLLGQSGVVVETRTHVGDCILGQNVPGHTRLETRMRKRIEENLRGDRLRVFDVGVIASDKPTGVGRLVIFTDAASGDTERQSVKALLQGLSGKNFPLDVDPTTLKPVAQCEIAATILNVEGGAHEGAYAANAEKLFKRKAKAGKGKEAVRPEVTVTIDSLGLTLKSPADAKPVPIGTTGTKDRGSTTVRLDDFVAFLQTFAKVHSEVTSDVSCWMGEAVLCFEFTTHNAKHRVFIPKSIGGHRSDRSIVKIKNQPWPEGRSLKPNNFD